MGWYIMTVSMTNSPIKFIIICPICNNPIFDSEACRVDGCYVLKNKSTQKNCVDKFSCAKYPEIGNDCKCEQIEVIKYLSVERQQNEIDLGILLAENEYLQKTNSDLADEIIGKINETI